MLKLIPVFSVLLLVGCAQTQPTQATVPRYDFVETELTKDVLPPPSRDAYKIDGSGSKYRDHDTPYIEDLRRYRDYLDTHISFLEKTNSVGTNRKTTACSKFVLPPVPSLPPFKPSNPNDPNRLLEETLDYTLKIKQLFQSHLVELDKAYSDYRKTCNL